MSAPPLDLLARVQQWIDDDPDPATTEELQELVRRGDTDTLAARFADRLHFGTAGLRGKLRAGPLGMNRVVVGRTAAGLAGWLVSRSPAGPVVIGYDARRGSARFARDTAEILVGAGLDARLFAAPVPTPMLAFAVRHTGACAGVMVTASHNPADDNGYKVYLGGDLAGSIGAGAQIVPPVAREIEAAIDDVGRLVDVPREEGWSMLGAALADRYVTEVAALPRGTARDVSIAYTPLHGVGGDTFRAVLALAGFPAAAVVPEQEQPDGDFPTVPFPNPEEPGALDLVLALAGRMRADIVIAHDPDADRCAVACGGRVLTGDELGALLADHLIRTGVAGCYVTTIVSSSLLAAMCAAHNRGYVETLTGFKWIVRGAGDLVFGYEEAIGYCVAPQIVRDKDGISAALLVADLAATLKADGRTLLDRLDEIAREYGIYATAQLSIRVDDVAEIGEMMRALRASPPTSLAGERVSTVDDLLPGADVVRLTAGPLRVLVRPSGTEPKLKAYLQAIEPVACDDVVAARSRAGDRLKALHADVQSALRQGR